MAYVEVWKSGRLLTRRQVDEEKARKGCRVRLGSAGEVRVAAGQSQTLGPFEVHMFEGDPPVGARQIGETAPELPPDEPRLPPLSVGAPDRRASQMGGSPDIKGYKIIEPLGRGGMGIVWRAEQLSTHRLVALKFVDSHRIESPKAQALFQREVELTARLDHPNIARIYDSGIHQGMYYYAMELVDGMPLDQYVKSKALSRNQILTLMRTVCQAVLFAHLRAVIHRDLKPSNILVSPDGQPHVLDFGLAKGLLEEDALAISVEGQIAGTPAYMSPEQAAGHHGQLDTRTDVFSLGVILYELLTGQSPHDLSGSMFDVLHRITEGRIRRPREVDKSIDGELEAILLTALAHNPDDRYPSAGALAKDICNYLDGEPLDARAHTIPYFLCKKALKYRVPVAVGLAVSLVLLGTILMAYTKVVSERALSESKDWEIKLKSAQLTWRELELKALSKNGQEARAALRLMRDEYVSAQDEISQLNHRLGERDLPVVVRRTDLQPGTAMASTALVSRPLAPGGVQSWTLEPHGHRGPVTRLAYSPDGSQFVSAGSDGTIRTWDAESGRLTKILVDPNGTADLPRLADGSDIGRFSWSADKATRPTDEITKLWTADLPQVWQSVLRTARAMALSPDRSALVMGDRDGTIRVLGLKSGQLRYTNTPAWCGPIHSVRFSSDSKILATGAGLGTICLWDAHRWQPLRKFEAVDIIGRDSPARGTIAWGPGNSVIARLSSREDSLEILDSQSGQVLRVLSGNSQRITSVSWAPDGTLLAAGAVNGKALVWDAKSDSNMPLVMLDAHAGRVNALAWTPQDQNLITAGDDGKIEIWDPRSGMRTKSIEGYPAPITCVAFSPDGNVLAAGSENGIIRLWDAGSTWSSTLLRGEPNDVEAREAKFMAVTWAPDGTLLASGDSGGKIRIWDPKSRRPTRSFATNCGPVNSLAWSADGRVLICAGADGTVRSWDAKNDFQEHVVLLPLWGSAGPGMAINREGDYRGPLEIVEHLRYVVSTERGQETLTPADFKSRFGWVNEPWQVGLYRPGAEQVKRIYVKADAQPPYDGNSWDTAFNDLQDALKLAQPDTEIWVAAGTYRPDRGTGAREASFHLKSGVRLFGGFAGTETSIDQRDPNRYETILSGDLNGDDRPGFANNDENSYHVVIGSGTDETAFLDGFTITSGNAEGPSEYRLDDGGGMFNSGGSPTIINCIFRHNSAVRGGAVYDEPGPPAFVNCTFTENKAVQGGAIHFRHLTKGMLANCTFVNNSADGEGGCLFIFQSIYCSLTNCSFITNKASYHGGAVWSFGSKVTVSGSTFRENTANAGGAGTYLWQDSSMFIDCTFYRNSTTLYLGGGSSQGGGVHIAGEGNAVLTSCRFLQNSADLGGALMVWDSSPKLTNCIFSENLATGKGGGICVLGQGRSNPVLYNCTIVRNHASFPGSGIFSEPNSSPVLANCILWNNTDGTNTSESGQIQVDQESTIINYCCIQGWSGKLGGAGNFALDPLFVDPNGPNGKAGTLDDDLRLQPASPCRNAGDNSALPADIADLDKDDDVNEPIPFDIEGKPRILDGVVDLGTYESS